jgi:hypothetical protein
MSPEKRAPLRERLGVNGDAETVDQETGELLPSWDETAPLEQWEPALEPPIQWEQEGQFVDGILVAIEEVETRFGEGTIARVRKGNSLRSFFCPIDLQRQLRYLPIGIPVHVTFMGEEPSGKGNDIKRFTVMVPPRRTR